MLKVVSVPLDKLKPDSNNVRAHGSKNLSSIVGSLRQFGQVEPLVVQQKTMVVIGGNGRLDAMKQLGWSKADVVLVDFDTIHARALGLALNRTAELAEWDNHKLENLIADLHADAFDLDAIGFDDDDLAKLLNTADGTDGDDTNKPSLGDNLTYSVIVTLPSESEQGEFLQEMETRGHSCRMLIS